MKGTRKRAGDNLTDDEPAKKRARKKSKSNNDSLHPHYRVGHWLPHDQSFLEERIAEFIEGAATSGKEFVQPVQELKDLIESDRHVHQLFVWALEEVPFKKPYNKDPTNSLEIRDWHHLLEVMNHIVTEAPGYNPSGMVGVPIAAILDWPMGTRAGYTLFQDRHVNEKIKAILDYWGDFLSSKASASVLNTSETGWLSTHALDRMSKVAYADSFIETFKCRNEDPEKRFGFKSWDDFFTREFRDGARPLAAPDDDNVIVNACESAPYRLETKLALRAKFWLKGQSYSLTDILDHDDRAREFVGGTLYQAFLSALSYHRWHSPISGRVVATRLVSGTYYSENLHEGFANPDGPDGDAPVDSQAYLTEMATRALIFIDADNPAIGLMCFVAVGMVEVSTNEITVEVGQHVTKGDQLGMFHFGGSTHCLIFRPGVELEFNLHGQEPGVHSENIKLRAELARVVSKS